MTVLLALIAAPLLGAAGPALRGRIGRWAPLAALAFEAGLLLRGPAGEATILGTRLVLDPLGRLALLGAVAMAASAALLATRPTDIQTSSLRRSPSAEREQAPHPSTAGERGQAVRPRSLWERVRASLAGGRDATAEAQAARPLSWVLVALALTAGALLVQGNAPAAVLLVECAALALVAGFAQRGGLAPRAAGRYLTLAGLAGVALLAAALLLHGDAAARLPGASRAAVGLLVVGLAILAAAFPFGPWLSGLARWCEPEDAPLALALCANPAAVLVVRMLAERPTALPDWPGSHALLGAGLASAGAAAVLAHQARPAPALAGLAGAACALALAGLAVPGDAGPVGALYTLLVVPPACLLGLLCLGSPEHRLEPSIDLAGALPASPCGGGGGLALPEGEGRSEGVGAPSGPPAGVLDAPVAGSRQEENGGAGLDGRHPIYAIGLAVAVLSLAGAPPLAGFAGRWAVLVAAAAAGDGYLLAAMAVSAVGVLAAVRLARPALLASARLCPLWKGRDGVELLLVALLVAALAALGLQPWPLIGPLQGALGAVGWLAR